MVVDFLKISNENLRTNKDIAEAIHLKSKNYISELLSEKNPKPISDVLVSKLRRHLDINPDYLREKSPQMFFSQIDQSPVQYPENSDTTHLSEDEHHLEEVDLSKQIARLTLLVKRLQKDLRIVRQTQEQEAEFQYRVNEKLLEFVASQRGSVTYEELRADVYNKASLVRH